MVFKATREVGDNSTPHYFFAKRSKGTVPYKEPLPYTMETWTETNCLATRDTNRVKKGDFFLTLHHSQNAMLHNYWSSPPLLDRNLHNQVHNAALNKVADKLSYVSNMFEAWYERREAVALLAQAGKGLLKFVKNWRKPDYWASLFKDSKDLVRKPETLPEAWLLANFAIKPLIGTVDDCMNLLLSEFPGNWVEGSSRAEYDSTLTETSIKTYVKTEYIVKHGVRVSSLNPNAQLLNIMGLTTPFSTAISVVPWGWAVNYLANISEIISNFEERFPGINVDKAYTTTYVRQDCNGVYSGGHWTPDEWFYISNPGPWVYSSRKHTRLKREILDKIPDYKFTVSLPGLGTSKFANLFSALALTMLGSRKT